MLGLKSGDLRFLCTEFDLFLCLFVSPPTHKWKAVLKCWIIPLPESKRANLTKSNKAGIPFLGQTDMQECCAVEAMHMEITNYNILTLRWEKDRPHEHICFCITILNIPQLCGVKCELKFKMKVQSQLLVPCPKTIILFLDNKQLVLKWRVSLWSFQKNL